MHCIVLIHHNLPEVHPKVHIGFSLCLAEGLQANGRLVTIDINEELESFTRPFFDRSAYAEQIDYRIADAQLELGTIDGPIS